MCLAASGTPANHSQGSKFQNGVARAPSLVLPAKAVYFLKQVNTLSTGLRAKLTEAETRAWEAFFFSFQLPIFQTKALEDDFVKDS